MHRQGQSIKALSVRLEGGVMTSLKGNWVLASVAFAGNPYDGQTLSESLCNAILTSGQWVKRAVVDKGYRKHNPDWMVAGLNELMPGQKKRGRLTGSLRRKLKRCNAVYSAIGHPKTDHRMKRRYLKGQIGDELNALGAGFGFNLRKVLKGLAALACAGALRGVPMMAAVRDVIERGFESRAGSCWAEDSGWLPRAAGRRAAA